jgi:hypothetical protein
MKNELIALLGHLKVWAVVRSMPYESDSWETGLTYDEAMLSKEKLDGYESSDIIILWDDVK